MSLHSYKDKVLAVASLVQELSKVNAVIKIPNCVKRYLSMHSVSLTTTKNRMYEGYLRASHRDSDLSWKLLPSGQPQRKAPLGMRIHK